MVSGFEKNITYIRRYDKEWEYKISGQFKECTRSFISIYTVVIYVIKCRC